MSEVVLETSGQCGFSTCGCWCVNGVGRGDSAAMQYHWRLMDLVFGSVHVQAGPCGWQRELFRREKRVI